MKDFRHGNYGKISEEQTGFRSASSTQDNKFVLNAFIPKYLFKQTGRFYVAFLDFKNAFDSVDESRLMTLHAKIGLSG